MKKNKITAFLLAVVIAMSMMTSATNTLAADNAADKAEYAYFMNTSEDSAYVWLGEKIEGNGMIEFLDGQAMGITDSKDIYYNETVSLDGLTARKQYNANSSYFKVSDEFYREGDCEFLFSIVYYDFGPSEGTFYFEYHTTDGAEKRVKLVKPGRNPGWTVKTVVVDDIDLSKTYDNGATIRIVNGAYNAFKKIEAINISEAKRENRPINITCMGSEVRREAESLQLIKYDDKRFTDEKLGDACTMYDAQMLRNLITATDTNVLDTAKKQTMTQGGLLDFYMEVLGVVKNDGESSVDAAKRLGITDAMDFFVSDDRPALNYHLLSIAHAALMYENPDGDILLKGLISSGFYDGVDITTIKSEKFAEIYYMPDEDAGPMYLPYETITDHMTGRKYHYINYFGSQMLRGYLNLNSWLPDGSGFICGTSTGFFYIYDIKSQTMTYLDRTVGQSIMLSVYMCLDGWAYYHKNENGIYSIWRINPKTKVKEKLYELPKGITIEYLNVSNDGRYVVFDGSDTGYILERPKDTTAIVRIDLWEKKLEYRYYSFDYSNKVNHFQINPVYTDIIGFSHETDTSKWTYGDIWDRCNIMDFTTGEVVYVNQGKNIFGAAVQLATHEIWSYDGEYRYFCSWPTDATKESGDIPAVIRVNKDGTHRQYYKLNAPAGSANHGNISGDNRMLATDAEWLMLISTETHQNFPIVNMRGVIENKNHPYHPHPHISYTGNMVSWGHVRGNVLGIAWFDYTDILENEVGKGGRYQFGTDVTRVSYAGVECESKETTKAGVECVTASPGKSLFFDINPEIVDVTDAAVKITFDYYDNSNKPLTITYTKGVEEYNDAWKSFNKSLEVRRENTQKWRTAEIVIDCGNFENIGKFESDFKVTSGGYNAYIANVKVEQIEHK